MTPDELRDLIAQGETLEVEFKRATRNALSDRAIVEAVVCLANGAGGHLILGVEDDGRVTGAEPRHGDVTHPHRLMGLILNQTDPHLPVTAEVIDLDGKDVIHIDVPPARTGPVGTRDGVFKRRSLKPDGTPECIPYRASEMQSVGFDLTGVDYATLPAVGATMDDLDEREFVRFREMCAGEGDAGLGRLSSVDLLRALRLEAGRGRDTVPALGAVLLFGTPAALDRWTPTAECLFQDTRTNYEAENVGLRLPLLAAAQALEQRIEVRNSSAQILMGMVRVDLPQLASTTVREVVANALVHRSYADLGPVLVQFGDDALTVTSPGGFPAGVTIDNLLDQSRPRSVALADAFKRAGLVERRGKGVNEMFDHQLRAGRGEPDYSRSTSASVQVVLPTGRADLDLVRFILTFERDTRTRLGLEELRVVHHLRAVGPCTAAELADDLRTPVGPTRALVQRLVERGVIEARGAGRNRRFHLTARFYALAEDRGAYVRVRGVDALQQEHMVLEYVRQYGAITRSQAAELTQVSPDEASRLLRRLAEAGKLVMLGQRRTARYELPESS